jgi:hypothetical protein
MQLGHRWERVGFDLLKALAISLSPALMTITLNRLNLSELKSRMDEIHHFLNGGDGYLPACLGV